jgi:ADP-heptose:LPS heptosyltransferase
MQDTDLTLTRSDRQRAAPQRPLAEVAAHAALRRDLDAGRVRRLLLVRHGRMGENLFWTPIPEALRQAHPALEVSVLTNAPDVWRGHPHVARILEIPRAFRRKSPARLLDAVGREARALAPDAVLVQNEPEALLALLRRLDARYLIDPAFAAGAPARPAVPSVHNAGRSDRHHAAEAAVLYASILGVGDPPWPMVFHVSDAARARAAALLAEIGLPAGVCPVFYCVGTNQTARLLAGRLDRTWPIRNFIAFARRVLAREDVFFYLSHFSRRERWMAQHARRALPPGRALLAPRPLSIDVLAALLLRSRCLVSCDTGPLHLASALGVPTLALFGPRAEEERTGPYLLGERARVLRAERAGTRRPCAELPGDVVADALQQLLAKLEGSARREH